jgi:hypothetical protein
MTPAALTIRAEMIRPGRKPRYQTIILCYTIIAFYIFFLSMAPKRSIRRARARRSRRCVGAHQLQVIQPASSLGFGALPKPDVSDLYMSRMGGGTGSVTTNTELGLKIVDFFDYNVTDSTGGGVAQTVTNYFWDCNQNLFGNGTSESPFTDNDKTWCRVRKLEVYVLPAKGFEIGPGAGPNTNNAQGMFTVQAQVPGTSPTSDTQSPTGNVALATDTQVTNVLPQIDTFWKKVLHCDLQKTFQSGVVRPYFVRSSDTALAPGAIDQCLFQMSVVNPTDGSAYLSETDDQNLQIRVKVVLHVDQPIATVQNGKLAVFKNETFLTPAINQNGPQYPGTTEQYVQTNLERVRNNMR